FPLQVGESKSRFFFLRRVRTRQDGVLLSFHSAPGGSVGGNESVSHPSSETTSAEGWCVAYSSFSPTFHSERIALAAPAPPGCRTHEVVPFAGYEELPPSACFSPSFGTTGST